MKYSEIQRVIMKISKNTMKIACIRIGTRIPDPRGAKVNQASRVMAQSAFHSHLSVWEGDVGKHNSNNYSIGAPQYVSHLQHKRKSSPWSSVESLEHPNLKKCSSKFRFLIICKV